MPTEIKSGPYPLRKELKYVRMTFKEFSELLARLEIDHEKVQASSNGAEFQGLTDIKSAPARFSGKPFVQIAGEQKGESSANACIEFENDTTIVSAGRHRGLSAHSVADDSLAMTVFEELKPFESAFQKQLSWAQPRIGSAFILGLVVMTIGGEIETGYFFSGGLLLTIASGLLFVLTMTVRDLGKEIPPVQFNPRETFWQRHGESSIVGILSSVVTGLVVWFLTTSMS